MDLKYLKKFLEILYVFYSDSYFSFFQSASIMGAILRLYHRNHQTGFERRSCARHWE